MRKETRPTKEQAYLQGQEAVRCQPKYAPNNPFDEEKDPDLWDAWEEGAVAAGITKIYTNGELNL